MVDSKLVLHCHHLRGRTEAVLGAHVQTVGKVLHQISGHHIAASASDAGFHQGGRRLDFATGDVQKVWRNDEIALV